MKFVQWDPEARVGEWVHRNPDPCVPRYGEGGDDVWPHTEIDLLALWDLDSRKSGFFAKFLFNGL